MRTRTAVAGLTISFVTAILAMAGCNGARFPSAPSSPSGVVTVYPATANAPVGQEIQFTAFLPSQPNTAFTWAVSGGSANGTISSAGVYTAPASVPSPATVTVTATNSAATNETGTAAITIVAAQGVTVSPTALAVPAGTTQTFAATVSGSPVTPTWQVNGVAGGSTADGMITAGGLYTAPLTPPPGGSVAITAVSGAMTGTAAVTVVFSNNSLSGPYAFSYSGVDSSGSLAVAGSFTASPATGSISGLEDYNSLRLTTVAQAIGINGTYAVYPDGSGTALLSNSVTSTGTETWQFTLTSAPQGEATQHAVLVRFDSGATGSGTMDQQDPSKFNVASISGNYVFGLSGIDTSFLQLQFAGIFNADSAGHIPLNLAEEDINDGGIATSPSTPDTSLHGSYSMDLNNPNSGRGFITLVNTSSEYSCNCQFAFYMVDNTHLKVVETDLNAQLSGDIYAAPNTARGSYTLASLDGHYAFTLGGADVLSNGGAGAPYAQGGVFVANGSGGVTGGVLDTNDGGGTSLGASLAATTYSVDPSLGRMFLPLMAGTTTTKFAAYAAKDGSLEMISLDPRFLDSGIAFPQSVTTAPQGPFALNLSGVVNASGGFREDDAGQVTIPNSGAPFGNLAINGSVLVTGVPLTAGSVVNSTDSNGRGTATFNTHLATYPLAYYTVDGKTVLVFGTGNSRTMVGVLMKQF